MIAEGNSETPKWGRLIHSDWCDVLQGGVCNCNLSLLTVYQRRALEGKDELRVTDEQGYLIHPDPALRRGDAPSQRRRRELCETWMRMNALQPYTGHNATLRKVAPRGLTYPGYTGRICDLSWWGHEIAYWPEFVPLFDHVELFYAPLGKYYVFTMQPYNVQTEMLDRFSRWCAEHCMRVSVWWDGWHYPGACPLIVIEPDLEGDQA